MLKNYYLKQLQEESIYFVQNEQELAELLDSIGISEDYKQDITGACLIIGDGDYIAVWLTEDSRYYDLSAIYHALPYYLNTYQEINYCYLPEYWKKENPFYEQKNPCLYKK